jgi:predicted nuclease of predicted toxin-antitoxin system
MMSMKFLLDMGLAPRTAVYLKGLGFDAVHLLNLGLEKLPDIEVVKLAESESRIVVTFDLDYPRIIALQKAAKPSVILFRLERFTTDEVHKILAGLVMKYKDELLVGAILVVEPHQVRLRMLPIW